jgi:hypothetical protein
MTPGTPVGNSLCDMCVCHGILARALEWPGSTAGRIRVILPSRFDFNPDDF